ncbi:MAG: ABC-F family ATP-binding cassette domain-containing protein [Gemmatimonadales bacterium]
MTLISMTGAEVRFGARTLLENVSFQVGEGERWGIVGRNGSGKTTLLNLVIGRLEPDAGTLVRRSGLRVAMMDQHREFAGAGTVWEAASGPFAELLALEQSLHDQAVALGEAGANALPAALARYGRDLDRFQSEGGYEIAARVDAVLAGLGFDPEAARTQLVETLSGGERGRLGLAQQLAAPADMLLLDEPTNHLDLDTTRWLEEYLRGQSEAVMLISHDRALLENVCDHMLHVEDRTAVAYEGGYSRFVALRAERRLAAQRAFDKQATAIAKEEEYIRRKLAGRHAAQAVGRRKRLNRLPRLGPPPGTEGAMAVRFETKERGGDQVIVVEKANIAFGERVLLDDFTNIVRRGEVIGLIGANGTGKSTLLKAITGSRPLEGGKLRVPDSISVGYYRQDLGEVPRDKTLFDIIYDLRAQWTRGQVQGHLGKFGFSGDSVLRKASTLSGGELARVALAMLELERSNLLVFDEPTNHLDVESIEELEDAIDEFDGTVLLVSHDRALLRALVTRVWILHEGRITDYPGTFGEWEAASAERAHAARVAAQEDAKVRELKERQKVRRTEEAKQDDRAAKRAAKQALAAAEAKITEVEGRIAALQVELGNPDLYGSPEGVKRSLELGRQLEATKAELDRAFAAWENLTDGKEG